MQCMLHLFFKKKLILILIKKLYVHILVFIQNKYIVTLQHFDFAAAFALILILRQLEILLYYHSYTSFVRSSTACCCYVHLIFLLGNHKNR